MREEIIKVKKKDHIDSEVARRFGQLASVVSVEESWNGGVGGWFAWAEYTVKVHVPEPGDSSVPVMNEKVDREKLLHLLEDGSEQLVEPGHGRRGAAPRLNTEPVGQQRPPRPVEPAVSTPVEVEPTIPQVMRMVNRDTSTEPLTVYVGLFKDAADLLGAGAYKAGALDESAEPVRGEVAYGLGNGSAVKVWATRLKSLRPSVVYAVVDPSRKQEDTALWLHELGAVTPVNAVVATPHGAYTITPGTIQTLGYPVHER